VIAHVGGVPLEETLLPLMSGAGAALLVARAWLGSRLRRRSDGFPSPDVSLLTAAIPPPKHQKGEAAE
jgi:hypothetical protein